MDKYYNDARKVFSSNKFSITHEKNTQLVVHAPKLKFYKGMLKVFLKLLYTCNTYCFLRLKFIISSSSSLKVHINNLNIFFC